MHKLFLFFVATVSMISAFLAGSGIRELTQATPQIIDGAASVAAMTGVFSPEDWHFILCLAFAGVLQLAIAVFWSLQARGGGLGALVLSFVFSTASAWVTAIFLVLPMEHALLAQQGRLQAVAPARQALDLFSTNVLSTAAGIRTASETADWLEDQEIQSGGTCAGSNTAGDGPRQRMRSRHAQALAAIAANAQGLADEALDLDIALQRAGHGANDQSLEQVFMQAVRLSRSPSIAQLRAAVAPIQRDLTVGWMDGGTLYTCPSPGFLAEIDAALSNLDSITAIPSELPVDTPPSTVDSARLIADSLVALVRGETPPSVTAIAALAAAIAVELVQIAMIRIREKQLRKCGLIQDGYDDFWSARRGRKRRHIRQLLEALDRLTWFDGRNRFYAMPVPANDPDARMVLSYFGMKLAHRNLRDFEIDYIDPHWVAARNLHGSRFDLYELPKDLDRWRRIADRDTFDPRDEPRKPTN